MLVPEALASPMWKVVVLRGSYFCQEPWVHFLGSGQIGRDTGRSKIEASGKSRYTVDNINLLKEKRRQIPNDTLPISSIIPVALEPKEICVPKHGFLRV